MYTIGNNKKTVYAENYGCVANTFDFEILIGHLTNAGYYLTKDINVANIILINTCGVKKPTEDRIIGRLRKLSQTRKPLIIAGCLPKINLKAILKAAPNFSAVLDPRSIDKMLVAIKSAENGETGRIFFSEKTISKLKQPKINLKLPIDIIAISEGCAGACTFCCVRFARGTLSSFPKKSVAKSLGQAVQNGAKEIWLTSQDTGAYGIEIKSNLAELLKECCKVKGKFWIRVGMMNPDHILHILEELIDAYNDERVFKFLHIPVQSGDNDILQRMNRRYSVNDYKAIIQEFRKELPDFTLSTDVICGFPGETKDAFKGTLNLVEEVKPDIVNISRFFSRPKTPAERMEQIDVEEVKTRSRALTKLVKKLALEKNRKWVRWTGEVLIDEKGKAQSWIGRNFAYKPIVVKDNSVLLGRFMDVKITRVLSTYLEAKIVK
jgi:threonylcarbamoyladenosine tRNA methylthiotransferase CDKAL1